MCNRIPSHVDIGETDRILKAIVDILNTNNKNDLAIQFSQKFNESQSNYIMENIYQAPEHTERITYQILIRCCNDMLSNLDAKLMEKISDIIRAVHYV